MDFLPNNFFKLDQVRPEYFYAEINMFNKKATLFQDYSMNSMKGLVTWLTMLTRWKGLIMVARSMVCFTPDIKRWLECIAKLLRALSP